jgi:hypothetical protein
MGDASLGETTTWHDSEHARSSAATDTMRDLLDPASLHPSRSRSQMSAACRPMCRGRYSTRRPTGQAAADHQCQPNHTHPLATVQDYLDGLTATGGGDVEIVWRSFYTCLFTGGRAS